MTKHFISRLVLIFIPSLAAVLICYLIPNIQGSIQTASILAVFLSIDIPTLVKAIVKKFRVGTEKFHQDLTCHTRGSRLYLLLRDAILLGVFLLVAGLSSGLIGHYKNTIDKAFAVDVIGIMLAVVVVLVKILYSSQEVLVVFGIFKNHIFHWMSLKEKVNRILSFIRCFFNKVSKYIIYIIYMFFI